MQVCLTSVRSIVASSGAPREIPCYPKLIPDDFLAAAQLAAILGIESLVNAGEIGAT